MIIQFFTISHLYRGFNTVKTFEDLVLEYDIPIKDRRKYDSLMNGIYLDCFFYPQEVAEDLFQKCILELIKTVKVPKHSYGILRSRAGLQCAKMENKWEQWLELDVNDVDWTLVHKRNFKCTIETQLKSFYFKLFHNAIALNSFLFKINKLDSPSCYFCKNDPETLPHLFGDCNIVSPLWKKLSDFINRCSEQTFQFSVFNYLFGINFGSKHEKCINGLFLCFKFYMYICKFQQSNPDLKAFLSFVNLKKNVEYKIAEKSNTLPLHFKKWSFDLESA